MSLHQASPIVAASLRSPNPPKQATGQEIRSRLLRRLGIHEQDDDSVVSSSEVSHPNQQQRPSVTPFHVPLKYPKEAVEKTQETKQSSVGFQENVSVLPIPMRNEYSRRIKARLWCDKKELFANAQRNLVEFEFEGWNWRNSIEDDCMIVGMQGELIHPAHCTSILHSKRPWPRMNSTPVQQSGQQQQQQQSSI